ncbi:MAG: flagellar biosynthetic protein FliR [Kiritimatiellae bacterium]|nr:flagellar biosynthetic protein FliR [Kiritimatiellia bacterium]
MTVQFGFWPQTFFLVLARSAGITAAVPFFGGAEVPGPIRIALALLIAVVLTPLVPMEWAVTAASLNTLPAVVLGMVGEALLGAAIGLVCSLFIQACVIGGNIISQGSGLFLARNVDPVHGYDNPIMGQLLQMTFVVIVLATNGHLVLLRLLAASFRTVPPQITWLNQATVGELIAMGGEMFRLGVKLAAPLLAASLILNVGLGLIARMAPDFNVLFLALPVRVFMGMFMTGLILRYGAAIFGQLVQRMLELCARVLS